MRAWYYPAITIVSVHEVYPGHYLQFLYARQFPSDVRKVFGAASNSEGWAHYSEQMMLDEGFTAVSPSTGSHSCRMPSFATFASSLVSGSTREA